MGSLQLGALGVLGLAGSAAATATIDQVRPEGSFEEVALSDSSSSGTSASPPATQTATEAIEAGAAETFLHTPQQWRFYLPLAYWATQLFSLLFYRNLFLTITDPTTFVLLQLFRTSFAIIMFPVRMSHW